LEETRLSVLGVTVLGRYFFEIGSNDTPIDDAAVNDTTLHDTHMERWGMAEIGDEEDTNEMSGPADFGEVAWQSLSSGFAAGSAN
jgi:hypothetical protein